MESYTEEFAFHYSLTVSLRYHYSPFTLGTRAGPSSYAHVRFSFKYLPAMPAANLKKCDSQFYYLMEVFSLCKEKLKTKPVPPQAFHF